MCRLFLPLFSSHAHTCRHHAAHQVLQQSIDHALEAVRGESEGHLRATAEFVYPKWPQLRAEITKVKSAATVLLLLLLLLVVVIVMLLKVLSAQLSSEEKKLQIQRLKQLRKQIKDTELDIFLAGQSPPRFAH